jgi:lon-related putative ATP-dependent protease
LRASFDPASLHFDCTDELEPLTDFVGQDRAIRSLQFGLGMHKPGYNIFVTGMTGTGKASAIMEYIRRSVDERMEPYELRDWCYVHDFDDPDRPNAISLAPGTGKRLRDQLEELLTLIRSNLTRIFASDEYDRQRRAIFEEGEKQAQALMAGAAAQAEAAGFALTFHPAGVNIVPLKDGRPITPDEYQALTVQERQTIAEKERPVDESVHGVAERLRMIEREVAAAIQAMDRKVVEAVVEGPFQQVEREYAGDEEVAAFLGRLKKFTLESADFLRQLAVAPAGRTSILEAGPLPTPDPFAAFRVNVLVDNSDRPGPPIVVEQNPTFSNLFGRIERRAYLGTYVSDHTMLKAGSVHRANGGYLIVNFTDLVTKPGSWEALKRVVRTGEVRIEDPLEQWGMFTPQGLRPEPIPASVKLVITGDPTSYFLLSAYDEEFWEMFKVKADFDHQIQRTPENALAYAGFVCAVCERHNLRHFDRTAVARLVEEGSRMVDDQERLSARFGRLRDLIIEADYWAEQDGAPLVSSTHVSRAVEEKVYRLNLVEERVRELIARGVLLVDVEGAVTGQVNGLAVLQLGDLSFGRPSRITARTYPGQRGVVSIDRETQLSGKIHDKGVLTLTGYLGWKFGQERPLSLSASISFEQGYEAIEGDSASLAETCAVLSALADLPLRQDLAITGSVNQRGEVQPIGGVNQKIEGFHDLCRTIGFTGSQGVIVPTRNVQNLMLREDVLAAAAAGSFAVYAVDSVDSAIELLTGMPAGERTEDGAFPEGTVYRRVEDRLRAMSEALRKAGRPQRDSSRPEGETGKPENSGHGTAPAETGD